MKNIFKILSLSKPLYKHMIAISLMILLLTVLQQIVPITLKLVGDEIQYKIQNPDYDNTQKIYTLVGISLVASIVNITLDSLNSRYGDYIASRLRKFLTEKFYQKIFTLPQKYFDSEISGKIVNQLNRGISTIQDFVNSSTNFILPAFVQSGVVIAILAYFSWPVAIVAAFIFPIYIGISRYSTRKWGEKEVAKNQIEDTTRGRIQEVISNIKLVRTSNTARQEWGLVSGNLNDINQIYDKQSSTYHLLNFLRNFGLEVIMVGISAFVFLATFDAKFTLGDMVLILQIINMLRMPLFGMSFILERIQMAESGSKEYFEILDFESKEEFDASANPIKFQNPEISFNNVSFEYDQDAAILKNIDAKFEKNQVYAIVGHSGAGKTTLINMILRFYEPTKGDITLNQTKYTDIDHQDIRNHIALVFQDNELFSTTIRENVAYGITSPSDEEIITALKQANAYDFVQKLPKGIDSEIGERGVRLSGGQKQRIQIARAIMKNSPILILDEATSSLDSKSESLVQEALQKLTKNKLVIIIAHRFSTIQNADQIIVIDNGQIVDKGNPKELAERDGIYSELLKYQLEGNKKLLNQYELY